MINSCCHSNSDDFFPDEKDSHSWHIYANAINSLWSTHHSDIIGDWDMFQSDHPFAEYHASRYAKHTPINTALELKIYIIF